MHITIQVREVYGTQMIYPACVRSVLFARLAGTKTITPAALRTIKQLGYEVKVEGPTIGFVLANAEG